MNLDIKDSACLHVVHILQHPTSRPTTRSTHDTMVNAQKMNFSPLPEGKYGKSTKKSTRRYHHANVGMSGLEADRVRALGALRSLRSKTKLAAEKSQETHFSSNDEKEKWIKDMAETETAVARKRVQEAETAIMQELNDMTTAENVGATTEKPETTFEEVLNAIGDSLSDLASSDEEQDGEDQEYGKDDTELGKLSDDDEPGWVMVVLATGPGNPPAVRVWTAKTGRFGSRTVQKPDPLTLGGPDPDPYPSTRGFRRVWLDPSVPVSGSAFRVSYLWSHSDMLLLIVKY